MKKFKCPYCFEQLQEEQLLFRLNEENVLADIQKEYAIYSKEIQNKGESLTNQPFPKAAFLKGVDRQLVQFWGEQNLPKHAYNPVLDPNSEKVKPFLEKNRDGSFFHRDNNRSIDAIQLNNHINSMKPFVRDRICPHCHNTLPDGYGKFPTRTVAMIGITGAGKTVYLSKLFEQLQNQLIRWGISAYPTKNSTDFINNNPVRRGVPLPDSTSSDLKQDPIYYELGIGQDRKGLLIYDIAGEHFDSSKETSIANAARYIQEADGFIMLLDPLQFPSIARYESQADVGVQKTNTLTATQVIHKYIADGNIVRCPMAVCISKVDMPVVQSLFDDNTAMMNKLNQDCSHTKEFENIFPSRDYNVVSDGMVPIIENQDPNLHHTLKNNYSKFNYFALTSLGCPVENGMPIADVNPRRIIEPLLWLLAQFNYINVVEEIHSPANEECPFCRGIDTHAQEGEREVKKGFLSFLDPLIKDTPLKVFGIQKMATSKHCKNCDERWN